MLAICIEHFVATGDLGPFRRDMGRTETAEILRRHGFELQSVPQQPSFYSIGHILFDFGELPETNACSISLYFPHSITRASDSYDFSRWPDSRIKWELGRFASTMTLEDAILHFPEFEPQHFVSTQSATISNRDSHVDLIFEYCETSGNSELIIAQANH